MTLREHLLALAAANETGLSFARFMRIALYHPETGYYARARPIGREGDFFTSVSVGPCFGFLLARQIREIASRIAPGTAVDVVEQGAHEGRLSADLLDHAGPGPAWRHWIVEPSPELRSAQRERLGDRVRQVPSLDEAGPLDGVFLCNELLDAFPVRRLRFERGRWREIRVVARHGDLVEATFDLPDTEMEERERLPRDLPDGFQTEVCEDIGPWIGDLTRAFRRGVALIIDYGGRAEDFFLPERRDGTVRAYREHRHEPDLLARPGETDLTADVNFTRVAEEAERCGWRVLGFADQAQFLTGILAGLPDPDGFPPPFRRQFQTLTHPGSMGRRFRVLALGRDVPELRLDGFRFGPGRP